MSVFRFAVAVHQNTHKFTFRGIKYGKWAYSHSQAHRYSHDITHNILLCTVEMAQILGTEWPLLHLVFHQFLFETDKWTQNYKSLIIIVTLNVKRKIGYKYIEFNFASFMRLNPSVFACIIKSRPIAANEQTWIWTSGSRVIGLWGWGLPICQEIGKVCRWSYWLQLCCVHWVE